MKREEVILKLANLIEAATDLQATLEAKNRPAIEVGFDAYALHQAMEEMEAFCEELDEAAP